MSYDEALAGRLGHLLADVPGVTSRAMFGGLGFMVGGHMALAASSRGSLMVRVDPDRSAQWFSEHVQPMEMRGRELAGWLLVSADGLASDEALQVWLDRGVTYARTLPAK